MTKLLTLTVSFAMTLCTVCSAQYVPLGKPNAKQKAANPLAFNLNNLPPVCQSSDIPTWAQLRTKRFDTHMQILTAAQAASLNITFGGITATGSFDQLWAVTDTSRVAPCVATDGKTTVYYGETIRTVVIMNDYTVKAGASIAIVAATATASGKSNSVDLYEIGFGDQSLDKMLVAAKATLGGSGITIENYSDFIKASTAAEQYASAITNPGIDVVAYDPPWNLADYNDMLANVWAIQKIAGGYGCEDAVKNYKQQDQQFQTDIRNTYIQIAGGCGVDDVGKAKAKKLLNGLTIKY